MDIYDLLRMPDTSIFSDPVPANETLTKHLTLGVLDTYLNRLDVRQALHIPSYIQSFPANALNLTIQRLYQWHYEGSGWIQDILRGYGYRTLHLFGDTDGQCTLHGVRMWINSLAWEVTQEWTPY